VPTSGERAKDVAAVLDDAFTAKSLSGVGAPQSAAATATGYLLQWTGSYVPVFLVASSAYLFALAIIHLLVPQLQAATLAEV
jgi:hypothetical protein